MLGKYNTSEDLLIWLKETFPNKLPSKGLGNIEEIRFLQGQQDVINVIEATYKESVENVHDE